MSWQAAGAQCAGPSVQEPSVHDSDASVQLVNSNKVKQTEQDVPNPSEKIFLTWLFYSPPSVVYTCVGEFGQHWFG